MHLFRLIIPIYQAGVAASIALILVACATQKGVNVRLPNVPERPLSDAPTVVIPRHVSKVTNSTKVVDKLVIGLGNGLHGFSSVELTADGRVKLVLEDPRRKHHYVEVLSVHPLQEVTDLLASPSVTDCLTLGRQYSMGLSDGSQGFLCLEGEHGKVFTFCDNAFPPAFRRAWRDTGVFIQRQPKTTWRLKGEVNSFQAYRNAKHER